MRIVIDMQGAQSKSSGSRGVGRYALNMAKALMKAMPEAEFFLALNGKLPTDRVMSFFEGILPRENIKTWIYRPHIPKGSTFEKQGGRPEELFREWFLHQFEADIIWIPNLQEGEGETEIATSAKLTRGREAVVTTLHDVSPVLLNKDILGPQGNRWYKQKIVYAGNCDLIITVSEFSREEILKLQEISCPVKVAYNGYDSKRFFPDEKYLTAEAKENYFLYCGGLDPHKNVKGLVEALSLLKGKDHDLLIAGKNPPAMENTLKRYADSLRVGDKVKFLGYVTDEKMARLMQRCRAFIMPSYAEGFGLPALEAMACGAPTLVSDATSLKEVVKNTEARFQPESADEMAARMERVIEDRDFAQKLIDDGVKQARSFSWEKGAQAIKKAFEELAVSKAGLGYGIDDLCEDMRPWVAHNPALAGDIACSIEESILFGKVRRIYIDASAVVLEDYLTGIQRVVYGLAGGLYSHCKELPGVEVKVVYSSPELQNFYEVKVNEQGRYKKNSEAGARDAIEFHDGDIFLMPDLHPGNAIAKREYLAVLSRRGVKVIAIVHDVIASAYPEFFNRDTVREFEGYLESMANVYGVIGDSEATLHAYQDWCKERNIIFPPYYLQGFNHLGVDFGERDHVKGEIPASGAAVLEAMAQRPTVLMVATLEPRKMHGQVLSAMSLLWEKGLDANLVFVGRQGWKTEKMAEKIRTHFQNGKKLFWLSGISDAYLKAIYESASGVVVASLAEGYGLPIIEAAHYGKPLLLRDIPVFREVAGDAAAYFTGEEPEDLARAMEEWLKEIRAERAMDSKGIKAITWEESARNLIEKIEPGFFASGCNMEEKDTWDAGSLLDAKELPEDEEGDGWPTEANKYFEGRTEIFATEGAAVDVLPSLKKALNLDGIWLGTADNYKAAALLKLCAEAYYRLKNGAYLVMSCKEQSTNHITAEKLEAILQSTGFGQIEKRYSCEESLVLPPIKSEDILNLKELNEAIRQLNRRLNKRDCIIAARKEG